MNKKEIFGFFVEQMLETVLNDYYSTEQYKLLQEKLVQMDKDCESNLKRDERYFVEECFGLLLDAAGEEEQFVYRRGMHDCVTLLKELRVLA